MQRLLDGEVFMNTLGSYRQTENDLLRGDANEGDTFWLQAEGATLSIAAPGGEYVPVGILDRPLRYSRMADLDVNVFCAYAVSEQTEIDGLDPRVQGFGDTFVAFINLSEFLTRLAKAAKKLGQQIKADRVRYFDESEHHGSVGPFRKVQDFTYQSEYRVAMFPGLGQPVHLNIGDLRNITITGRTSDLSSRMYFHHP